MSYRINACGPLGNYAVKIIREVCDGMSMTRERTRSCGTSTLYPNRVLRARSECVLHRRQGTTTTTTTTTVCDPASCQRDHERSGDRVGSQSLRTANGATWFEYRHYSLPGTGSRRGIRDSYSSTRTVSAIGSRARHFPLPARAARSLPSEITAIALTAFSHVPVARVTLVLLGNERRRETLARARERKFSFQRQ